VDTDFMLVVKELMDAVVTAPSVCVDGGTGLHMLKKKSICRILLSVICDKEGDSLCPAFIRTNDNALVTASPSSDKSFVYFYIPRKNLEVFVRKMVLEPSVLSSGCRHTHSCEFASSGQSPLLLPAVEKDPKLCS